MTKDEEALALRVAKEQYYEDSVKWPEEYTQRVIDYAARFLAEIRKTQTPVAWIAEFPDGGKLLWDDSFKLAYRGGSKSVAYQPLYATPRSEQRNGGQVFSETDSQESPPVERCAAHLLTEVYLISEAYDKCRAEKQFAIDDLEYDLFAAGWKACAMLAAGEVK